MRIVAEAGNDFQSYLALVQYSAAAGDKRTANLAAQKAVDLAPKKLKKQVRQQAEALKSHRGAARADPRGRGRPARSPGAVIARSRTLAARTLAVDQRTTPGRSVNFHIEDEAIDDATHVIELGGEVDLYTAPEFKERMVELIESGKKQIVVDLSKATFIDSTTLGVLVGGVKRLRPAGGSLALVCTDENITKIFEITGLDRVFPIHSSRDDALAAVTTAE